MQLGLFPLSTQGFKLFPENRKKQDPAGLLVPRKVTGVFPSAPAARRVVTLLFPLPGKESGQVPPCGVDILRPNGFSGPSYSAKRR